MHPYHHPLFVEFLVYFNKNQDYFEGHEVLEEYWKSIPSYSKSHPLTAFILLSTAMYHWRRGNLNGALRTINKALHRFSSVMSSYPDYSEEIHFSKLIQDVQEAQIKVASGLPFELFKIDVLSSHLNSLVQTTENQMLLLSLGSNDVIHKHKLRDRSDILKTRDEKKKSGR